MKLLLAILFFIFFQGISYSQEFKDCQQHRNGFFIYKHDHRSTVIYREDNYQIEYDIITNQWVTIKLRWLSDCKYGFTYLATTYGNLAHFIGNSMVVDIVQVDETGYTYRSNYNNGEMFFKGRIEVPETPLSTKNKRKIRKKLKQTKQ